MNGSLADVARVAGVAPSTASIALRNAPGRIPKDIRARVKAVARGLGYTPDGWRRRSRASIDPPVDRNHLADRRRRAALFEAAETARAGAKARDG
jgi:DNA-binding LacI/PurR family transcriptional regulator